MTSYDLPKEAKARGVSSGPFTSLTIAAEGCINKNNPVMKTTAKRKVTRTSCLLLLHLALLMEMMLFQMMILAVRTAKVA